MKLIFLVATFFCLFPIQSHAAWIFVPDALIANPAAKIRFFDAAGVRTEVFFNTQPVLNGGFVINALTPALPTALNAPGLIVPPLTASMIAAAAVPLVTAPVVNPYTNAPTYTTNWTDVIASVQGILPTLIGAFLIGWVAAFVPSHFVGFFSSLLRRQKY